MSNPMHGGSVALLLILAWAMACKAESPRKDFYLRLGEPIRMTETVEGLEVESLGPPDADVQYRYEFTAKREGEHLILVARLSLSEMQGGEYINHFLLEESAAGSGYDAIGSLLIVPGLNPKWPPDDLVEAIRRNSEGRIELFAMEIRDPQFLDLFTAWREQRFGDADVLAAELARRHSGDWLFRLAEIDAAMAVGDEVRYDRLINSYVEEFGATRRQADTLEIEAMQRTRQARRLDREGKNLYADFGSNRSDPASPLDTMLARFRGVTPGYTSRNPDQYLILSGGNPVPNLLHVQVAAKLTRVLSDFAMLQGQVEQPVGNLKGAWQTGLIFSRDGVYLIDDVIGIAVRGIAMNGIETAFLNAMTTSDQIAYFFPVLDDAYEQERSIQGSVREQTWESMEIQRRNSIEYETRKRVSFAHMALAHSAAAARHRFLSTGRMPGRAEDFGPLLPDGPDPDPFDPEGRALQVRHVPERDNVFTLYSLGPDGEDQRASIAYDPTNGSISAGDLFTDLPREREFPFPPPGKLATTAPALLRQFPNGLPPDPFADHRLASYIVTHTDPAWILSAGPDVDSSQKGFRVIDSLTDASHPIKPGDGVATLGSQYLHRNTMFFDATYDPTNGILSDGDIFFNTADPADRTPME